MEKIKLELFVKDVKYAELYAHPTNVSQVDAILIELLKFYTYYLDLLTVLGVAGIFSLINKDNTEGFYSVGNSIDIIDTIQLVIDYIEDNYIKESILECIKIFDYSVENKMIIIITYKPIQIN